MRSAQVCDSDIASVVDAFYTGVVQPDIEVVIFFCSSHYDLDALAVAMKQKFAGIKVMGCTTSGEIGPLGYQNHSLSGVSLGAADFNVECGLIENLKSPDLSQRDHVQTLLQALEGRALSCTDSNCFAFMLVDGLSMREEKIAYALQSQLGKIPLIGGSAGDDQQFIQTGIYFDGHFHHDAAAVCMIHTELPFEIFKTQHFESQDERMVVTRAVPEERTVYEINGLPAAAEYARLLGVDVGQLDSTSFASCPVVVRIGGMDFVRSIQKVLPGGGLQFYCAIDEGVVLRTARGVGLLNNLQQTFANIHARMGDPALVLGCDCVFRRVEIDHDVLTEPVGALLKQNHVVGFNSYGEQFRGIHVNQTLTGVVIGHARQDT